MSEPGSGLVEVAEATKEAIGAVIEEVRSLRADIESVRAAVAEKRAEESAPEDEPKRDAAMLPQARGSAAATDRVRSPYERFWWREQETVESNERNIRANVELAMQLVDGAKRLRERPVDIQASEELTRLWRAYMFEKFPPPAVVAEQVGDEAMRAPKTRAMDTQESGYGAELVGAQYVSQLWEAARNTDGLLSVIPTIQMTAPTTYVPIDGSLPEMLLVGESVDANATAYPTSKTGTNRRTLTAKKFTIQQIWSAELTEDSIVGFVELLRAKLAAAYTAYLGSAVYNGDMTNAATGNINSDDADPADTRHYLAWDGIRHYWLVDDTGNGVNGSGGALTSAMVLQAIAKLAGPGNSVNALDTIDWGADLNNLRIVINPGLRTKLMGLTETLTVDKIGPQASIVAGQIGALFGIPIIAPAYAAKTEADGKLSATATNNTLGQLSVVSVRGWLRGEYRGVQMFMDRIQRTDQFLIELYTRQAFTRWGADVAAGVYNVTSD
ncbi:phage major capsid protein [Tepidiforma sp.]|uniref:phage major capsid protein n=1 Tax=Tepidiforma sp. TaxID=2682230 RepID=UPI00262B719F|nr:phage major capsid protein [Tepidiforma sp.]MCX7618924.1 phage major capsid protein [Tepidiforma sp.]